MLPSRREFVRSAAGAAAIGVIPALEPVTAEAKQSASPQDLLALFKSLPGDVAVKIHAPATNGKPEFLVESNAAKVLFVGSAFKSFVLCEALRQVDAPDVSKTIASQQLTLDASVWSFDSASFNPPNLIGKVSERTALEAMILHSDNTATDMCLKHAGPDKVRAQIAAMGLKNTTIPDSTRAFIGYLLGAKDIQGFTWDALTAAANQPMTNAPLNKVCTMSSSADDFVSYYSRALQGEFFKNPQTLNQFRQILSMGDAIWKMPLPLGVSAFLKGGSIDVPGFHALCVPGGMFFDDRWVYFCLTINWTAAAESDPATVQAFAAASSRALALVKEALSA
ncbi:MAG: serine hydrolase [Candidatus Korobacteraceae bacterium]